MAHTYEYPRPSVTVDCVIFRLAPDSGRLQTLLIQRDKAPFQGCWALPGGFVEMDESLDTAAARELGEETGLAALYLEQLYTYGAPGRDPRGRVISVAYFALLSTDIQVTAGSDARAAQWFDTSECSEIAFDHSQIIERALERLRAKVRYAPLIFSLMPPKFTIADLQRVYESVTGLKPDARHFRRKVEGLGVLASAGSRPTGRRPATLYRFDAKRAVKRIHDFHL
jgi:8-oxo-dGTP diphosphatase